MTDSIRGHGKSAKQAWMVLCILLVLVTDTVLCVALGLLVEDVSSICL